MDYWEGKTKSLENKIIRNAFSKGALKWGFTHGVRNKRAIDSANWEQAYQSIDREGQNEVQLALFYDYKTNVEFYPVWQAHLRNNQVPMLVTWGEHDPYFSVKGANLLKNDVQDIDIHVLDTGHFPLEEESDFIIDKTRVLMSKVN
ncbi:alpha/beta fold hydrolase [Ningiella sp. W23]|uniref:alpha/beta fold hydrolase n=1 Tax=Ningiella sp. W23 TaxID=3023715 RepID=UPI003756AAEC